MLNSSRNVLKHLVCEFVREKLSSTSSLTLSHTKILSKQETFSDKKAAENIILCVKIQHPLLDGTPFH